jgi:ribitol-5-phosphate 2-dehydrogenase (NADP+)
MICFSLNRWLNKLQALMINYKFELMAPKQFKVKLENLEINTANLIIRPTYLSICRADQRYYYGNRKPEDLLAKLPMALIHEAIGVVVADSSGQFKVGDRVVLIPNQPNETDLVIQENYLLTSKFRGSGYDGFMQEYLILPGDRVVRYEKIEPEIAVLSELISVGYHSVNSFLQRSHRNRSTLGIWGDGSLGYIVSLLLRHYLPKSKIFVFGRTAEKLSDFTFVDQTYIANPHNSSIRIDHAFECVGGSNAEDAIDQIIKRINPEGMITLMGVSENNVPVSTRQILEKGLMLLGRSRSGRCDFEEALKLLSDSSIQKRLNPIISNVIKVRDIEGMHYAFAEDFKNPYKTIMEWNV